MSHKGLVLVVDDEPALQRVLKVTLESHGYHRFPQKTLSVS